MILSIRSRRWLRRWAWAAFWSAAALGWLLAAGLTAAIPPLILLWLWSTQ